PFIFIYKRKKKSEEVFSFHFGPLGIARGCGWQKFGALINIGAYYIVGVPSAAFLAFFSHLSGKGLWMGIMFGTFTQLVFFLCFTLSADWEKEVASPLNPPLIILLTLPS
ncbi:hypothetical protein EJ110_NYTH06222, partial [Nymphaea thermarum]